MTSKATSKPNFDLDLESCDFFDTFEADGKQGKQKAPRTRWQHTTSIPDVLSRLRSDVDNGLGLQEVQHRLSKQGPNILTPPRQKPIWRKILDHFTDFFSLLLQFAAILCFIAYAAEPTETMHLYLGLFLYTVVVITSLFSFVQQHKSDQTLRQFRNFLPPKATVIRHHGEISIIDASQLVVGDITLIKLGDKIPADVRILQSNRFTVDNSSLTGESEPVELDARISCDEPLEATNLAFFGCLAVDGSCKAVVISTGDRTVFGEIAQLTTKGEKEEGKTTLQRDIHHFVISISAFAFAIGLLFFCVGAIKGTRFIHNVIYSIGIIVSNIPEGLLATVTVSLTASARRMGRRQILVKQLDAVETLGSTTVICSDKTGTLTQNLMSVSHIVYGGTVEATDAKWSPDYSKNISDCEEQGSALCLKSLMHGASVCSTAVFDAGDLRANPGKSIFQRKISGDASEAGILRFTQGIHDVDTFRQQHKLVAILPFNSKNKYMATVHKCPDSELLLRVVVKGAPEIVLSRCTSILAKDGIHELTDRERALIEKQMNFLAGRGERVLAYGEKLLSSHQSTTILNGDGSTPNIDDIPTSDFCFLGLVSLIDPPREGVLDAVKTCKNAGIKVIMVTGDHPETAKSVAQQVGIITNEVAGVDESWSAASESCAVVIRGSELQGMTEEEWNKTLSYGEIVFARTSPHHKLQIVQNLQRLGEVVTVTGDGCNDAPALKQANTGVAMGISGSEVSREAASIVILDDHFASIVNGVEEGRLIFDNLKKSIAYTLTSNVPQLIPFLVFLVLQIPLPLTTILILSIDLGTDIFPAIALAYEGPESDIMKRPPRKAKTDHLMNSRLVSYSTLQLGIIQTFAGFFAYLVVMNDYGLAPRSLVKLNAGSHFATGRFKDQRWMFTAQDAPRNSAYEASWFSRDAKKFEKYFATAHPGFLKQTHDIFSLLPSNPDGQEKKLGDGLVSDPEQFSNMLKIIGFEMKKPSCIAFQCNLDAQPATVVINNLACFDPAKNSGLVKLEKPRKLASNSKVIPGRRQWEGCFDLWTPHRQREVLRRSQTSFFAAIVVAQVFTLFVCKTRILSLFWTGVGNAALVFSLVLELMVSYLIVYSPLLRSAFGVRPLRLMHWLPGVPFGLFIICYDEIRKKFIRKHIRNESGDVLPEDGFRDKAAKWIHDFTLW